MAKQGRSEAGKFAQKSVEQREVRSIRLTDTTWEKLGAAATLRCITRADLIEEIVDSGLLDAQPASTSSGEASLAQVATAIAKVLSDPVVTRNGKDRGSVKRALQALLSYLS